LVQGGGAFQRIQAQISLAFVGIETVAGEAGIGQDGTDLAVELDGSIRAGCKSAGIPEENGRGP
jgi:hypothetical protein